MMNTRKLCFAYIVWICLLPGKSNAQTILIDSLRNALNGADISAGDRIMTMGGLARALHYRDIQEAIRIERQALTLAKREKDGQYGAFTYGTLTYLYVQANDLAAAQKSIDSALWFAERSSRKDIKGFVWYRKGWLEYVQDETDKSMRSLLQALQLLEGQGAHSWESGVYYFIAGIYFQWKDEKKYDKYVRLALQSALLAGDPDDLCRSYQAMGSSFMSRFRKDNTQRQLLDSVLHYNNIALQVAATEKERLIFRNTAAVVALNNANLFFEFYPAAYRDSTEKYINTALQVAREIRYPEVIANCYGILSEYEIREGRFDAAERILQTALAELETDSSSSNLTRARMVLGLSNVAERAGDAGKALRYYKDYVKHYEAYFDAEKMSISKKLEAQYQSDKQEQALAALEERAAFNRKLNFFYVCLILASLLALIFLFRAYHFRLKAARRQQQLLAMEKEDAHLQSQLQAAEAQKLQLEKQEALLQASLREQESARLQAEQLLLHERQERLQKELLAGTLQVEEKNELLQALQKKITEHARQYPALRQMDRIISESRKQDDDYESLKADFAGIHPEFFTRLQEKAGSSLTRLDLKYCSYIMMGLSTKEIANRLGVEPKSIRMARYRLKQKLGLQKEDSLDQFINTLV